MSTEAEALVRSASEATGRGREACHHPTAREIRLYTPHGDAAMARARLAQHPSERLHVSKLYAISGGWAFVLCRECPRV